MLGSASAGDAPASASFGSLPPPPPIDSIVSDDVLDEDDWAVCREFGLDSKATQALKRLAAVSHDACKRVLRKLVNKADIGKPSAFIGVAAKNALAKETGER